MGSVGQQAGPPEVAGQGATAGPQETHQDLRKAQQLLERNSFAVFKLNGLLMLRRQRGGCERPTAEERRLLGDAQACLQQVAMLLAPKVLMPPVMAQRLRQQLQPPLPEAAPAAAEGGSLLDAKVERGQQAEEPQHQQQPQVVPPLKQQPLPDSRAPTENGSVGFVVHAPPPPWHQWQDSIGPFGSGPLLSPGGGSWKLPPQQQQQQQQGTAAAVAAFHAPLQHTLSATGSDLLPTRGLSRALPSSFSGTLTPAQAAAAVGPCAGLSLDPAQAHQQAQQEQGAGDGQPMPPIPSELGHVQDKWLLAHAYSSMTTDQKEKLAAQTQEVRTFVLRARMCKVREQLEVQQQQRVAVTAASGQLGHQQAAGAGTGMGLDDGLHSSALGSGTGGLGDSFAPGVVVDTALLRQQGGAGGVLQHSADQQQQSSPAPLDLGSRDTFRHIPPEGLLHQQGQQQQQQEQLLQQQPLGSLPPVLMQHQQSLVPQQQLQQQHYGLLGLGQQQHLGNSMVPLQQQEQQQQGLGLASQPLAPMVAATELAAPDMFGGPGMGLSAGIGGGMQHFTFMTKAERLVHLRRLKREQEEWLERQRLAATALQDGGGEDGLQ